MDVTGLALCSRYSYPPNSLSLCGPDKKNDLGWYSTTLQTDLGTKEILSQFSTLYPYLCLIAAENRLKNPFDNWVVEAYWLGNELLQNIPISPFASHLAETLNLKKKMKRSELEEILEKLPEGALPCHAFHVLNVYKRTGHIDSFHTIETMDACLINWGQVKKISSEAIIIETKPLRLIDNILAFGKTRQRTIFTQGKKDMFACRLQPGDWVSYHWGYFCQKINKRQLSNLIYYTNLSLKLANIT